MSKIRTFFEGILYFGIIYLISQIVYYGVYFVFIIRLQLQNKTDITSGVRMISFIEEHPIEYALFSGGLVLLVLLVLSFLDKRTEKEVFKWHFPGISNFLPSIILGIGIFLMIQGGINFFGTLYDFHPVLIAENAFERYPFYIVLIGIGVVVPIIEELIYRGFILAHYEKAFTVGTAIILQSIMFSVSHMSFVQGLFVLPLAIVSGLAVHKTNSVFNGIWIHMTFNLSTLWVAYMNMDVTSIGQLGVLFVAGIIMIHFGIRLLQAYDESDDGDETSGHSMVE